MNTFINEDFLLTTDTAKTLYHNYAKDMPIVDYHCHVSPQEIYEDKHFENISQVWLSKDHYKWRLMRSNGVDEHFITGDASDWEKFQKFAEMLPKAIGNPMYHWCHLELKTYFGYEGILNGETAKEVWNVCNDVLKKEDMGVRGLIKMSNVKFVGTTDDPTDSLIWHKKLAEDNTMECIVAPSFRPDKALNIDKEGWKDYLENLSVIAKIKIYDTDSLKEALRRRIAFFDANGCRASDHGLDRMVYVDKEKKEVDDIVKKALAGCKVTREEADAFKTRLLVLCAGEYKKLGWVMQLHYNCLRDPNSKMFHKLGPDTGFDCIGTYNSCVELSSFLDKLYSTDNLPKTIIYSLNTSDNAFIDTIIGSFQGREIPGKIQHGSAWWFNDHKKGMREQLTSLGNLGLLGNFVGMLTDSRSFLSYARHEYFRRILCALIGEWVENGEFPNDIKTLGEIVEGICYNNAVRYFGLEEK